MGRFLYGWVSEWVDRWVGADMWLGWWPCYARAMTVCRHTGSAGVAAVVPLLLTFIMRRASEASLFFLGLTKEKKVSS